MLPEFVNEPLTDFSTDATRQAFERGLKAVRDEFGRDWPLVIGGQPVTSEAWIDSLDPCATDVVVGRVSRATQAHAEQALDAAWRAFEDWSRWQPAERARVLVKLAALLRARKHLFSATMVYEAGKTWPEADADTAWPSRERCRACLVRTTSCSLCRLGSASSFRRGTFRSPSP
jgi:1-pyrroline-5-carboxylate dehydrogenase